jgi:hypothetical protein
MVVYKYRKASRPPQAKNNCTTEQEGNILMATIRVKKENLEKAIAALRAAGFSANECKCPPSQAYSYRSYPDSDYGYDADREEEDTKGMAGIDCSASGNQAHKVFLRIGMFDSIEGN